MRTHVHKPAGGPRLPRRSRATEPGVRVPAIADQRARRAACARGWTRRRAGASAGLLAVALGVFLLLPPVAREWLMASVCLAAAAAALSAARRSRGTPRALWGWIAVLLAVLAAANAVFAQRGDPVVASGLLAAGLVIGLGVAVRLVRLTATGSAVHLLDLGLVAAASAVTTWHLFLAPLLAGARPGLPLVVALVPGLNLALLALLLRAALVGPPRLTSHALLVLAAATALLGDTGIALLRIHDDYTSGEVLDVFPFAGQVIVGLAATHPSAPRLGTVPDPVGRDHAHTLWVVPAALSVVVLPWVVLRSGLALDPELVAVSSAAVVLLLVVRSSLLLVRAHEAAVTDPLTGVANRREFSERLAAAAAAGAPAVVYVDLDDFKAVNDARGHAAGDELLIEVAARLRAAVRPTDLVARLGGDEFALLLDRAVTATTAEEVAGRAAAVFAAPFRVGSALYAASGSVGLVPPLPGAGAEDLVTAADLAMYEAKRQVPPRDASRGRTRLVVYGDQLAERVRTRRSLAAQFSAAVEAGPTGGLLLHYQPVVHLGTGRAEGVEALLRWQHPERGLLEAGAFLGLEDSPPLERALDAFVLAEALRQAASWSRRGGPLADLRVGVNLSVATVVDVGLVETVAGALARAGVPPDRLVLEVTEHAAVVDSPVVDANVRTLVDLGVRTALDDFGVGYTSLSYLERFSITCLKVDRSLVGTLSAPRPSSLVGGIAALAADVGLTTVAEGVESGEQAAELHRRGVSHAQGHWFAPPLSPGRLEGWLLGRESARPPA